MAAPMKLISRRFFPVVNCSFGVICRGYSPKQKRPKAFSFKNNPRKSAQYPYIPGDPVQEEQIERLNLNDNDNVHFHLRRHRETRPSTKHNKFVDSYHKLESINNSHMKNENKHISQYGHVYEKLKDGDLRLGRTILKAKSSKDSETILLEGQRLIRDSISLGAQLKFLYFSSEDLLKDLPPSILQDGEIFKIPYKDMKTWSDTTTPPGILGVFRMPGQGESYRLSNETGLPLTVILDRVKDPGNVGTLIRTSAAVGCERILLLKGCANAWESKVLRSGMGSHFAVPVFSGLNWSQVYSYIGDSTHVFLADARQQSDVVVGLEKAVSVEQADYASSTESDSDDDDNDSSSSDTDSESESIDVNDNDVFNRMSFPVIPYSNIILHHTRSCQGEQESVALVIGNETDGLSPSAKRFGYNSYGTFVTVPMEHTVDSLNTAVAGSIILYELRRKLLESIASSSEG